MIQFSDVFRNTKREPQTAEERSEIRGALDYDWDDAVQLIDLFKKNTRRAASESRGKK